MLKITIDRNAEEPCLIEVDAENMDELKDDTLSLAKLVTESFTNTADTEAERLERAKLAKKMLLFGANAALLEIAAAETDTE